jgi:hypothetical protein
MRNTQKDGGGAFPQTSMARVTEHVFETGMTLRDYFAARALQGMIASGVRSFDVHDSDTNPRYAARRAYEVADAMLAERQK